MSPLKISQDDGSDATVVSNLFIDEYMIEANDAQIKIFLYLLRMMGAKHALTFSDLADKFNYTEKDILRALRYWERKMLLRVEYDEEKNPIGIHLRSIGKLRADTIAIEKPMAPDQAVPSPPDEDTLTPPKTYEKPEYSPDMLKAFRDAEDTSQLLFVVEQYLGKTLSSLEIQSIIFFIDILGFSTDLVEYLIEYCVSLGHKSFHYIEKVAIGWAKEGIATPEQARKAPRKFKKIVYDVMKALGKNSQPTKIEAAYVLRWSDELGISDELVLEACARTVLAVDSHRFEYCNKIIEGWHAGGVSTAADVLRFDTEYQQKKKGAQLRSGAKPQTFGKFKQNSYDFEALEKELAGK